MSNRFFNHGIAVSDKKTRIMKWKYTKTNRQTDTFIDKHRLTDRQIDRYVDREGE